MAPQQGFRAARYRILADGGYSTDIDPLHGIQNSLLHYL
jgi:hypothetical protein